MAGIFILILLSFALFYFLTRTIWVRIIKDENFKIEIHLPLLSLHFTNESRKKSNKKTGRKINFIDYYRIITDIVEKTKNCDVVIDRITLPIKPEKFSTSTLLLPMGQRALICSVVTYLGSKIRSLTVQDNAITLSPDIQKLHFYLTVKLRLFQMIYTILFIRSRLKHEKRG